MCLLLFWVIVFVIVAHCWLKIYMNYELFFFVTFYSSDEISVVPRIDFSQVSVPVDESSLVTEDEHMFATMMGRY